MAERTGGLPARVRVRWASVRVRTTAVAVLVVGATLAVSAVAMVVLLRRSLTADVRSTASLRAEAVAGWLAGEAGGPVPVSDLEEEFAQVLDGRERVVHSSANVTGEAAIALPAPGEVAHVDAVPFEDDPFVVVADEIRAGEATATIVVGRALDTVAESTEAVTDLLTVGFPMLLIVVGATTWRLVGRSLSPVEAMREEAEAISTKELHRRVPDPGGDDEIARLATTMNRMLARLEAGNARRRRFVSDASHELRSPVTTMRQHAEVALEHPDRTSVEELAAVVVAENARLQSLVEDLLLLARADEDTLRRRTDPVDLADLLFEEAGRLRRTTGLRIDTAEVSAARVAGDREQLVKLIRNLTDNAARHCRGTVGLSLADERGAVLAVDDDGPGIPADERARVFERFIRLDEARDRDSGGSGLGLAIVVEIAAAHGARVSVGDGVHGGARFEVRFPPVDGVLLPG